MFFSMYSLKSALETLGRFILILAMPTETRNQHSYSAENCIKQPFGEEISVKNVLRSVVVTGNSALCISCSLLHKDEIQVPN